MITLITQMVGCLLVAAGIGVAVGWLLRGLPKNSIEQPYDDLANLLRTKEQALETTSHDLKVKTSAMQILEQKIMSSETLYSSAQRELAARGERVKALEAELASRSKRLADAEAEGVSARQRANESASVAAAQAEELRGARQACRVADQAREVMEQEIRVLREHIAQLNDGLADRDRLRAHVEKLESLQGRVHQLEVELSDREAAHRGTIQQFERALAEREQRIADFDVVAATQADELRAAQQACQTAEQAREVLKEEIRVLREQIAQLNEGLADRDRLRAQVKQLEAVQSRVHQLEVELSDREATHRGTIQQLERSITERDRRISEFDAIAAAQAEELRGAQQACRAADQAREVMEQEIRVLREHIAQLNDGLADRDRLRAHVEKLESLQGRVHQLEVELSDREAAHRGTIQQLERSITERDRRIEELVPVTHLLREKESDLKEWERKYERTVREHEVEVANFQEQCATQDQLRAQHLLDEQQLHERDEQIAALHRQLHDLQAERQRLLEEVQCIPGKDEHIDRLQKRLKEMRAALRSNGAPAPGPSRQTRHNGAEPHSQGGPPKAGKDRQEDDLKKISGIGPAFAHTLNKMGTRTFIQIARWKPEDIAKIAKKLDTDPERIKRDNWIAAAKKQHYRKYGERL
jgi:predicted flap endonuclease-1-like 5' DNA nuclease/predicted  nucleic acid-binding Zn-ribbon protein